VRVELTALEARVLGCLIEKELTTPDQYPLSLNALTAAVNQKTNRDPVMELDEPAVQAVLDGLGRKHLILEKSGFGSRVLKYQHRLIGTEFSEIKGTPQERGLLCVLLLRGPQTVAELRTRTNRLCDFQDAAEVESVLTQMAGRDSGALVVRLARARGEREARYMHLLCGPVDAGTEETVAEAAPVRVAGTESLAARVERLERELAELRQALTSLTQK
jgi:uncharacterized protein